MQLPGSFIYSFSIKGSDSLLYEVNSASGMLRNRRARIGTENFTVIGVPRRNPVLSRIGCQLETIEYPMSFRFKGSIGGLLSSSMLLSPGTLSLRVAPQQSALPSCALPFGECRWSRIRGIPPGIAAFFALPIHRELISGNA